LSFGSSSNEIEVVSEDQNESTNNEDTDYHELKQELTQNGMDFVEDKLQEFQTIAFKRKPLKQFYQEFHEYLDDILSHNEVLESKLLILVSSQLKGFIRFVKACSTKHSPSEKNVQRFNFNLNVLNTCSKSIKKKAIESEYKLEYGILWIYYRIDYMKSKKDKKLLEGIKEDLIRTRDSVKSVSNDIEKIIFRPEVTYKDINERELNQVKNYITWVQKNKTIEKRVIDAQIKLKKLMATKSFLPDCITSCFRPKVNDLIKE